MIMMTAGGGGAAGVWDGGLLAIPLRRQVLAGGSATKVPMGLVTTRPSSLS
jgi:hypothetical protein